MKWKHGTGLQPWVSSGSGTHQGNSSFQIYWRMRTSKKLVTSLAPRLSFTCFCYQCTPLSAFSVSFGDFNAPLTLLFCSANPLCHAGAAVLSLPFCSPAVLPTPALQPRADAAHPGLHSTSRESGPSPLLPQPPTDHPRGPVSASRDNEHQRVLVTITFRNDVVVTANPFS